ncbi:MAG: hypothetical protein R2781_00800 [Flavobacteriaceae bacterium]
MENRRILNVLEVLKKGVVVLILLTFFLGGWAQFFIGIPVTLYAFCLVLWVYVLVFIDILARRKIIYNYLFFITFLYLVYIIFVGILRSVNLLNIIFYTLFALAPLAFFYLMKVFEKRELKLEIEKLLKWLIYLQLPILLLQKFGYYFLIGFKGSSQVVAKVDFMFGTFFLKADHALGFFLIMYLLSIFIKIRKREIEKIPWFIILYIITLIFLIQSNLTKIILLSILLYYVALYLYKKLSVFSLVIAFILFIGVLNIAIKTIPALQWEVYHIQNLYTPEQSHIAVERGYAKRPQVIIDQLYNYPLKIIGNGPYDYFDLSKSAFKNTIHFSQLIWTYNDLGLVGVILVFLITYLIVKKLHLNKESFFIMFFVLTLYLFMTTFYNDVAIMLTLFLLKTHFFRKESNTIQSKSIQ